MREPSCRHDLWLWLPVSIVLVISLAGCSGSKSATRTSFATATGAGTQTVSSPGAGDTGPAIGERQSLLGGGSIVIYGVEWPVAQPLHEARNPVLAADVEICAGTTTPSVDLPVSPFQFQLELANHRKLSPSPGEKDPAFQSITLAARACTRGWVTFVLSPGEQPADVAWATGRAGRELEAEWALSS